MKDKLGRFLVRWRVHAVLPHIHGRLLDIGCGTNDLVRCYGHDSIGIDVYQWGDVDIVVDDSAILPFDDEDFQTVTIVAALNHIPNRDAVLKEAYRVLKRNGRIIVTMIPPRISGVWHFLRSPWDVDQRERGMVDGEVFGLTKNQVMTLLKEAGFEVLLEKTFMLGINRLTVAKKT